MRRLRSLVPFPPHLERRALRNAEQAAEQMQRHRRAVRAAGVFPDVHGTSEPKQTR
jgi:hypothetical protein